MKVAKLPSFPVICGQAFANNTGNHNGTPHICDKKYHLTGPHQCRECGTQGY